MAGDGDSITIDEEDERRDAASPVRFAGSARGKSATLASHGPAFAIVVNHGQRSAVTTTTPNWRPRTYQFGAAGAESVRHWIHRATPTWYDLGLTAGPGRGLARRTRSLGVLRRTSREVMSGLAAAGIFPTANKPTGSFQRLE